MAMMFEHLVRVRWRDTDAQGHVNHAVFLTYLEEGRDAFYAQVLGSDPSYVVVRLEVDLRAEVRHLDQQVTVRIQAERLGTTSLTTRETILTSAGEVAAEARVVTVRWDPGRRQPIPFDETERTRLTEAMARQPPPGEPPHQRQESLGARAAAVPPTTRSAHELLTGCNQRAARRVVIRFERSASRSLVEAAGCDACEVGQDFVRGLVKVRVAP
jgi:acyl-CoA thioester hydrolase